LPDKVDRVVAFEAGLKDSLVLEPEFYMTGTQRRPHELHRFEAVTAGAGKPEYLKPESHAYSLTEGVKKKIIARSRSQYTGG
jgi:hypothetical protein